MPKSAFQPIHKSPSKQESQGAFFSPARKEQPFFQTPSSDTVQAKLEPDAVSASMEEEEASASMEMQEDEAAGAMEAPQEEESQPDAAA